MARIRKKGNAGYDELHGRHYIIHFIFGVSLVKGFYAEYYGITEVRNNYNLLKQLAGVEGSRTALQIRCTEKFEKKIPKMKIHALFTNF
jgi:hypothetical protein